MIILDLLTSLGLPEDFHFLRPRWLLGILLAILLGLFLARTKGSTRWEDLIPPKMLEVLRVTGGNAGKRKKWLIPLCLSIACIAAAGPAWKKIPVPTTQAQHALVILLDLSPSMLATDLAPDRLTRVRFKLIDILRSRQDGQTALIAYAGSPHRVAPLTDDVNTIEALLPALNPIMMPIQGSAAESAIELAMEMFESAGVQTGDILMITDGVAPDAQRTINNLLNGQYRLSILGIGSTDAVPIPRPGGGLLSDSRGEIVLTELNRDELQILAGFNRGRYVEIQTDDSDISYLLQEQAALPDQSEQQLETLYDSWEDIGYYLVLLLLPIAAYSFRPGLIFCLPLLALPMALTPQKAEAFEWQDLWLTPDQQGSIALKRDDPATAAEKFEDRDWAAYARYRDQEYETAGAKIEDSDWEPTALSHYNRGNALALNGDLEEAIASYDNALELEPSMEDAEYNKSVLEELLNQQEQQDQQQSQQQNDQQDQNGDSEQQQNSDQSQNTQNSENQNQSDNSDQSEQSDQQNSEPQQAESGEQEPEENESDAQNQNANAEEQEESDSQEEQQANADESSEPEEQESGSELELAQAEETPEEMTPASEQWLRAIPDDPSGLLRRKFEEESEIYEQNRRFNIAPPSQETEARY